MQGEVSSADVEATASYPGDLGKIIHGGGYHKPQIFSVEETAFYWKKMPSKTFTTREKSMPDFKSSEDRLPVLLVIKGAGDFKKLILIYQSKNPRAL